MERIPESEEIHNNTPDSTRQFIEEAVLLLGEDNVLDLSPTICDFGLDDIPCVIELLDDEDAENLEDIEMPFELQKIILHIEKKGAERLEFVYLSDYIEDEEEGEKDEIKFPNHVTFNEEEGCYQTTRTALDLEYMEVDLIVDFIMYCLNLEVENGGMWDERDLYMLTKKNKYILSFEPSIADSEKGDSLVIRKNEYPESCYAYRVYDTFLEARKAREEIFEEIVETTFGHYFDNGPSDICTMNLSKDKMQSIVKYLNRK